jgi:hypothetical protein
MGSSAKIKLLNEVFFIYFTISVLTLHILLSWEIKWNKIVEILKIFLELGNIKCSAKLKILIITSSDI